MRNLRQQARTLIAQAVAAHGTPIVLHWWAPATGVSVDPTTGAYEGSGVSRVDLDTRALCFYEVTETETRFRQYEEVSAGCGVLDLPASLDLSGKLGLEFEINGERWIQKEVGEALRESWQLMEGEKMVRTYLLKRKT
jgi:hypothetical protein